MIYNKLILALFLILICASCSNNVKDSDQYLSDLRSEYNFLKTTKTNFTYKGAIIYSLGIPDPKYYTLYGINHFFYIKDGTISMLSLDKNCYEEYKVKPYKILSFSEINNDLVLDPCNIISIPFISLNQVVGDTVFFNDEISKSGYWSLLVEKKYSNVINDTIYKFNRHIGSMEKNNWIYYVTKQKGIIGMAKMDWGVVRDSIGFPFVQKSIKIDLDTPDATILKYIQNVIPLSCSKKFIEK